MFFATLVLAAAAFGAQNRTGAPSQDELMNATYTGIKEAGGPVALVKGEWTGQQARVTLVPRARVTGDFDADGRAEAATLVAGSGGETGEMIYLAIVGRSGGKPVNVATVPIGDRVQVRSLRADGRRVVLDLVQAGPNDAMCCPGDLVTRSWELQGSRLKEGPRTKGGRLAPSTLGGTFWVLRAWAFDEPAPADPVVTLQFEGGRINGNGGCNGYFGSIKEGGAPGEITLGPVGATQKFCQGAPMEVEARYLKQLGAVRKMSFVGGQLGLTYDIDGNLGVMLFERSARR